LWNIYYFWLAPTLTYQIAFPKTSRVRFWKVVGILFRMVLTFSLFSFLVAQVVSPNLELLVNDLESTGGTYTYTILADYWLKLTITNTYIWLLVFYFYFHLWLNLFAEILRFGDRVFYKDWWNSTEVSAYWRLWNLPVHYWLVRHLYFPCVRLKFPKMAATFVVFFFSAVMHELLISIPFHMLRPWS
jgi:diacylglycerol O-acyltransferase-1